MTEWILIDDSSRITAAAYDAQNQAILVRFPDGVEWQYLGCPEHVWEDFMAPNTSKGRYISQVLNHQQHSRLM
ncbi:hypothetical protein DM793_07865 [Paenarthrobacter nitroguajacolicus]|uniref:KTSC domain-containing protein n=1 Tax=Paenarthrobacter nitroguajacolicus TaxID=211146 RepID=UPI0015C043D6|nr:KTSC domain-containing protein [Paenarthrobacter nitroguajacolicus]NWL11211.1 hypothetical protein [Paenarthrobacter nitroguajacolicus]